MKLDPHQREYLESRLNIAASSMPDKLRATKKKEEHLTDSQMITGGRSGKIKLDLTKINNMGTPMYHLMVLPEITANKPIKAHNKSIDDKVDALQKKKRLAMDAIILGDSKDALKILTDFESSLV